MGSHKLFLCLGGNLGNKAEIFADTLQRIKNRMGQVQSLSSIYASPAWGFESENEFWNRVVVVETCLSPLFVLEEIRIIENHYGRKRESRSYSSRKMDIDILFYDNLVMRSDELTIPHPLMEQRNFVLVPLLEVAPEFVHPVSGKTIAEIFRSCTDRSEIHRIDAGSGVNKSENFRNL